MEAGLCVDLACHTLGARAARRVWPGMSIPAMVEPTEAEWIERAKGGDHHAFGVLVRKHQPRLYGCAAHMMGDRSAADDVVQETFIRAFRALERFDARAELGTWLYRICINVALNSIRKRKRTAASDIDDPRIVEPAADPAEGSTDPERALESARSYAALTHALDALSPSLRATVVMVLIDGMPQKEAADVLGCSEGTIAWRVHEARRRLREALVSESSSPDEPARVQGGRR